MNTITNIRNGSIALAALFVLACAVAFIPVSAHATEMDIGDYVDTSYYDDGYSDYYNTSYYDSGVSDYYNTSYYDGSYGYSSYSTPSYSIGGYSTPSYRSTGYSYPSYSAPGYSYSQSNTCTAVNSCNTSYDDHSIFYAPTTVTTNTTSGGGYPVYTPVYPQPYPYPVPAISTRTGCGYTVVCPSYPTPSPAPYVTLSAVPYTGLDLGPVGTALYWGFLVAWCALLAYLIVYKKVQNKLVASLFGTSASVPASKAVIHYTAPAAKKEEAVSLSTTDAIDPFIASQIAR